MRLAVGFLAAVALLFAAPAVTGSASACSIPDPGDADCDGVRTDGQGPADNCPDVRNADQRNTDAGYTPDSPAAQDGSTAAMASGDSLGDACDDDEDADAVPDASDNCRLVRNPAQLDSNGDGRGENAQGETLCPPVDSDADGTVDDDDNCPSISNPDQQDTDQDRRGDICEYDDDGDGVSDGSDNCPLTPNSEQGDRDRDGIGTACDPGEAFDVPPEPTPTPTAADSTPPTVRLARRSRRRLAEARGGMPTRASCSEACALSARVTARGRLLGRAEALLGDAGRTYLIFRWRRRPAEGLRARLVVRAVDRAGNRRTLRRHIRFT